MNPTPRTPAWFILARHWLSLVGMALVTTAGISWLFVLPLQIRGHVSNPYLGIIVFLILPIVFFTGLGLIPIGIYLGRQQVHHGLTNSSFDRRTALRRLAWFFGITTLLNIGIGTQVTYRAVNYMETKNFCGTSCHQMRPEFAAYQNSPHSRVECVECHVAPGAAGWVASKANGARQCIETVFAAAPKPTPSALESNRLVPARQTCENCHWPQQFSGTRLRIFSKYADDETNTHTETVMLMLIGGDRISGIHGAHLRPGVHIRYVAADRLRQTITSVEYRNELTGEFRKFSSPDPPTDSLQTPQEYEMQCVDCHNRPTHTFELPDRAMDKAMAFGQIPVTLPFIKKRSVEALKANYVSSEDAGEKIPSTLTAFYRQNYPELYRQRKEDISQAAKVVFAIYNRNVFPDLKVTWGTYPNNLGHTDSPGCFRCHDGSHTGPDGKSITADCSTCHRPLAMDEASPQILKTLGIADQIASTQKQ